MNNYQLSKIADMLDEDALRYDEIIDDEEVDEDDPLATFKQKYLEFYDDIKTTPRDDW